MSTLAGSAQQVEHTIVVAAPADAVYQLIAVVTTWPELFGPTVHIEVLERAGAQERFRIWATAGDTVKSWSSVRHLNERERSITFRQEVSQPPVATMSGRWSIEPLGAQRSLVRLSHDFRAVNDDPTQQQWIANVVDRNSTVELESLRATAEQGSNHAELSLSFQDTVTINGSLQAVYDFIYRARDWPDRLPHVSRLDLHEDQEHVQVMEMDTSTADGRTHTTKSVRVCFPHNKIVYKQLQVPPLLTTHLGQWLFEDNGGSVQATSVHTVAVKPDAVAGILGPDATVADAKEYVRHALSRNSSATLRAAKSFVEQAEDL